MIRAAGLAAAVAWPLLWAAAVPAQETASGAIDWQPCTLGGAATAAECATLRRPLLDEEGTGTIDVTLARIRAASTDATTRVWYVAGGPGDAATLALPRVAEVFADMGVDIYAIDHRGTGGSARLGCPGQEGEASLEGTEIAADEWPACIAWIRRERADLDGLTAAASAGDLGAAIARVDATSPARDVVFGASYGTYLVSRYLERHPGQPDGVILDGLVPTDWTLDELDTSLADFGDWLLARCADDAECSRYLGADPAAAARDLAQRFDDGHCADLGVDGATVRLLLGNLAMGGPAIWPYIPPLIHRLDQCRLRDLLAVGAMVENLFESGQIAEDPAAHSPALQRHVALSEMWPDPAPSAESLESVVRTAAMTTGIGPSFGATYESWPRYPRPEIVTPFAEYDGPALLLHGGLDPTMPLQRLEAMLAKFDAPGQSFVLFPDAGHVVLNENPCARSIYATFIQQPGEPLDLGCIADTTAGPLHLASDPDPPVFGTDDLWGDSMSPLERQAIFFGTITLSVLGYTIWFLWRRRRARRGAA